MALSIQEVRASCPETTDEEELARQFAEIQEISLRHAIRVWQECAQQYAGVQQHVEAQAAQARAQLLEERVGPCYRAHLDTFPLN